MRRSNFALRLRPSLLEELRKAAGSEGVALNQLINVPIARKPRGYSNARVKGILRWKPMNSQRGCRRSQAGKRRMGETRSASGDKRKESLLIGNGEAANPGTNAFRY